MFFPLFQYYSTVSPFFRHDCGHSASTTCGPPCRQHTVCRLPGVSKCRVSYTFRLSLWKAFCTVNVNALNFVKPPLALTGPLGGPVRVTAPHVSLVRLPFFSCTGLPSHWRVPLCFDPRPRGVVFPVNSLSVFPPRPQVGGSIFATVPNFNPAPHLPGEPDNCHGLSPFFSLAHFTKYLFGIPRGD